MTGIGFEVNAAFSRGWLPGVLRTMGGLAGGLAWRWFRSPGLPRVPILDENQRVLTTVCARSGRGR